MFFTNEEIQKLLERVSFEIALFGAENIGVDVLSEYEKQVLIEHGIDIDELTDEFTPYEESFLLGRLVALIGEDNTKKIDYDDFRQYIYGSQFLPLSDVEKLTLDMAKRRSYNHIRGLETGIKKDIEGIILDNQMTHRSEYEKIIRNAISRAKFERSSIKSIISEIGNKTGDWQRDLGRIADTEMNTIFQEGISISLLQKYGDDAKVYKDVYEGACRHCIRLYLTGGIGSKPRVFKLGELISNGTNVGRKVNEWKAVVGSTHPWCRCLLRKLPDDYVWNEDEKNFVPKPYEGKRRDDIYDLVKINVREYLKEQQQIWKNSNTKFFKDDKDRIFFYGKDNVKYQLIDNNLPNRPIKIEIRLADSRNLNPVAISEFEKNNDGTYSQSMTGKLVVSKKGVGLARAIYDYFDSVYGRIKPSKNLTDDGEAFWNKNK